MKKYKYLYTDILICFMLVALKYIYQTKCIRSPFIWDMRTNQLITGLGGIFSWPFPDYTACK